MTRIQMKKSDLIKELQRIAGNNKDGDVEKNHILADRLIINYIDDPKITKAYDAIHKWYA